MSRLVDVVKNVPKVHTTWEKKSPVDGAQSNKYYIGLAKDGGPFKFVTFEPRGTAVKMYIKLPQSQELDKQIEAAGLDMMGFNRWNLNYRLRLTKEDISKNSDFLMRLIRSAWEKMA
ncbi:MAG: hypothetical protein HYY44_03015 [Deltaproteobacteria bacterium]|nr:hypothetical protein [Deltaproteobacteria bacterium]